MRLACNRNACPYIYWFASASAVRDADPGSGDYRRHHPGGVKAKGETVTYRYVSRYYVTGDHDGPDFSSHV